MKQHELVKHYYGQVLQGTADLKTDTCCTASAMPAHVKAVLELIHDEVQARYYGCGLVIPEALEGLRVLDLGCGSGRDALDAGRVFPVCGNTWRMLKENRLRPHFEFLGEGGTHYGIFGGCGTTLPFDNPDDRTATASACC